MSDAVSNPRLAALSRHGFFASALVLAAVGAFMVFAALELEDDQRAVAHTHRNIGLLNEVRTQLDGSAIEARNFLLSGDAGELVGFRARQAQLSSVIERLLAGFANQPDQESRALRLQSLLLSRNAVLERLFAKSPPTADVLVPHLARLRKQTEPLIRDIDRIQQSELAVRARHSHRTVQALLLAALLAIPASLLVLGYGQARLRGENRRRAQVETQLQTSVSQLRAISSELEALGAFSGMLQSASTVEELYALCARTFPRLFPGLAGTIYVIKASRDYAEDVAHWGQPAIASEPLPAPGSCWAIRRQRPYVVADAGTGLLCAHCIADPGASGSTACVPLGGQGESFGWLSLSSAQPIDADELKLAANACEQLSLALGNARLRDALRHQSVRDGLTGLYNRRYLEEGLAREISRCTRRKLPLCVLMFDLDHFKSYNDTHGHAGGDLVLAMFGKLLESSCRGEDIPCRYGGEEFALVLPEASMAVAAMRAEQIRKALGAQVVMHMGRELERVSVSVGIAALPANGPGAAELLQAADAALYRAKQAGRDRGGNVLRRGISVAAASR